MSANGTSNKGTTSTMDSKNIKETKYSKDTTERATPSGPGLPLTFSPVDRRPGYHANAVYGVELADSSGLNHQLRLCSRWNRGFCSRQDEPRCRWESSRTGSAVELEHLCTFVLPCSGELCASTLHTAKQHKTREPAHCWTCFLAQGSRARLGPTFHMAITSSHSPYSRG